MRNKKNKIMQNAVKYAMAIILLLAAYFAIKLITNTPEKWAVLKAGYISVSTQHKAIVIADEIIYSSLNDGYLADAVAEGSRVKKGQVIATLIANENANTNETEDKDDTNSNAGIRIDAKSMEKEIQNFYSALNDALRNKDKFSAKIAKRELTYALEYKKKFEEGRDLKEAEFNAQEKYMGANDAKLDQQFSVIASESGTISYMMGELDGKLNYADRYSLDYKNLFSKQHESRNMYSQTIKSGEPGFKIIQSVKWHLMCQTSLEDLESFSLDDNISLQIAGEKLEGKVVDKFLAKDTGVVALQINEASRHMVSARLVDLTIVKDKMAGVLVPQNALVLKDNEKGVFIKGVGSEKVFRPIEILGQSDGGYIVSAGSYTYKDKAGVMHTVDTISSGDSVLITEKE